MAHPKTVAAEQRICHVREQLQTHILPELGEPYGTSVHQRLDLLLEHLRQEPEVSIVFVGSTGAGKSTLLNALLAGQLLPTSALKPCTSVVTAVRSAPGERYRAEVRFLSEEEWRHELRTSEHVLRTDSEEEAPLGSDWETLKRAQISKLRALYGWSGQEAESAADLEHLALPEEIRRYLQPGTGPLVLEEDSEASLQGLLREYLSGEHRYWPLVKSVDLSGPFPGVRTVLRLVDLPGVNDPNEAREEVTRKYLREASYLWVLFNIKRGLTKDIRTLLLDQQLLRQLLLDGKLDALTLIGTHADDVDTDEATLQELALDEEASLADVIHARNARVRTQLAAELDAIAEELARQAGKLPGDQERLQAVLARTQVFTVSSRAYTRLRGLTRGARDFGLRRVEETEVPQLLAHMDAIGRRHDEEARAQRVEQELDALLQAAQTTMHHRRAVMQSACIQESRRLQRGFLHCRIKLDEALRQTREEVLRSFLVAQDSFLSRLEQASQEALAHVGSHAQGWGRLNWLTLRILLAREGRFTMPLTQQRYDLNASLAEPFLQSIPFAWDEFFGDHMDDALRSARSRCERELQAYLTDLDQEVAALPETDDAARKLLAENSETMQQILQGRLSAMLSCLRRTIASRRQHRASDIRYQVQDRMRAAYRQCQAMNGKGMKTRVLQVLEAHARQSAEEVYNGIRSSVQEAVEAIGKEFGQELQLLHGAICQQAGRLTETVESSGALPVSQQWELLARWEQLEQVLQRLQGSPENMLAPAGQAAAV